MKLKLIFTLLVNLVFVFNLFSQNLPLDDYKVLLQKDFKYMDDYLKQNKYTFEDRGDFQPLEDDSNRLWKMIHYNFNKNCFDEKNNCNYIYINTALFKDKNTGKTDLTFIELHTSDQLYYMHLFKRAKELKMDKKEEKVTEWGSEINFEDLYFEVTFKTKTIPGFRTIYSVNIFQKKI